MQALSTAAVTFLRSNVAALEGRVHVSITPEGTQLPSAVVDTATQHDGGLVRSTITVRVQTEAGADDDAATDLADLSTAIANALTGRSGPELELPGFDILDVAGAGSTAYAESSEGRRVLYEAVEYDVMLQRVTA